ncbi:MAG: MATE family efflux transporter [Lachnospiraceae bacterium]|nr:MATE family efflux transporter [Lachnospiraceae bacterium]
MTSSHSSSRPDVFFENGSIPQIVWTLALPTIITQVINMVYNFADTWYIGRTGNAAMVAAANVCMPVFVIMAAIANVFGIGGASVISRSIGQKNPKRARRTFAFCLYSGLAASLLYMALIALFRPQLILLIGGDSADYGYIYSYMFWTMIVGALPTVGNVLCGHLVRSIGASKEAGIGMSLGGVLNMVLDPLFMFVLLPPGHEVTGAAIATMLSNTVSLLYFVVYLLRHRDNPIFTVDPRDISFGEHIPGDVLTVGIPAGLQTTLAMVSNMFANALSVEYGTEAVAGMGVAKKINMIAFNTCMGMTQGVLPLFGYCIGAKEYTRLRKVVRYTAKVLAIYTIGCVIVFKAAAPWLVAFFIDEPKTIAFGTEFLSVIAWAAPLCAVSYMVNSLFQAAGSRLRALLLAIMRKGVVDIPAMFVFKSFIGAAGIVWATPFAEIVSAAVAVVLYVTFMKKLPEKAA